MIYDKHQWKIRNQNRPKDKTIIGNKEGNITQDNHRKQGRTYHTRQS